MHTLLRHIVSHLALVQNLDSFQTIFIYFHWHQKYVIGGYRIHHVDRSYVLSTPPPLFLLFLESPSSQNLQQKLAPQSDLMKVNGGEI